MTRVNPTNDLTITVLFPRTAEPDFRPTPHTDWVDCFWWPCRGRMRAHLLQAQMLTRERLRQSGTEHCAWAHPPAASACSDSPGPGVTLFFLLLLLHKLCRQDLSLSGRCSVSHCGTQSDMAWSCVKMSGEFTAVRGDVGRARVLFRCSDAQPCRMTHDGGDGADVNRGRAQVGLTCTWVANAATPLPAPAPIPSLPLVLRRVDAS